MSWYVVKMIGIVLLVLIVTIAVMLLVYEYAHAMDDIWKDDDMRFKRKKYRARHDFIIYTRTRVHDGNCRLKEGSIYELREVVASTAIMHEVGTDCVIYITTDKIDEVFEEVDNET